MKSSYEIAVIGKGMMGCATAKYLAKAGMEVILIGPDEPVAEQPALVYASHYDAARIFRRVGTDDTWTRLNLLASNAFPEIEQESGIQFHFPVSCLYVSEYPNDPCLTQAQKISRYLDHPPTFLTNSQEIHTKYPMFSFPHGVIAMIEPSPSGYIRPLKLIAAQLQIFLQNKGYYLDDTVVHTQSTDGGFRVHTHTGRLIEVQNLVVCAGSFSNFNHLTSRPLSFQLKSETVLLVEVPGPMPEMPCLLWETERPDYEGIYLIGPVEYPDGRYYIKMGCNLPGDTSFTSLDAIRKWFAGHDHKKHLAVLIDIFRHLVPGVAVHRVFTKPCIIARTPHGKPYIGRVSNHWFIVAGGNGYAAKCSDAIGKTASDYIQHGRFDGNLSSEAFVPIFA